MFGSGTNGSSVLIIAASRLVHGLSEENALPHRSRLFL